MSCKRKVNWKYNIERGDEGSPVVSQQRTQRLRGDEPTFFPLLVTSDGMFGSTLLLLSLNPRNGTFFTISTARVRR